MTTSLIAFGANLGNRTETLDQTCQRLSSHEEITRIARSRPYQSSPIGGPAGQEDFLNAALLIDTSLSPRQLLLLLQTIETELGRQRHQRWDQRPIDLDLLLYDTLTIDKEELQVPHPHMAFRRFVLEPAVEIAPALIHPSSGWTIQQLYEHLNSATNYLALIGPTGSGKTKLARDVCDRLGGQLVLAPALPATTEAPEEVETQLMEERLQQLDALAELITPSTGSGITLTFAISDFWLNQSYAYVRKTLSQEAQEQFQGHWKTIVSQALQPKLRVLLDPAAGETSPSGVQQVLRELALQPFQGPLLHLTDCHPLAVVEEVSAAVLSMQ
jgi:2-amino-4-hydroxy-6-hydroxymethyldihydropteridine diphosphokinase